MSAPGTYLPTIHAYGKDRFINTAEIQFKKLNIFNVPEPGSPVSQISSRSRQRKIAALNDSR
jgi:hypothetical protein